MSIPTWTASTLTFNLNRAVKKISEWCSHSFTDWLLLIIWIIFKSICFVFLIVFIMFCVPTGTLRPCSWSVTARLHTWIQDDHCTGSWSTAFDFRLGSRRCSPDFLLTWVLLCYPGLITNEQHLTSSVSNHIIIPLERVTGWNGMDENTMSCCPGLEWAGFNYPNGLLQMLSICKSDAMLPLVC